MCDYSLGGIRNRLAVEGEELIVHRFRTRSIGLAAPADLGLKTNTSGGRNRRFWQRIKNYFLLEANCSDAPAVCIPPGASLILKNIPVNLQHKWYIAEEELVTFVQTSAEANTYRDAIAFRNGRQVLLQHLAEGLTVKVVSLGGDTVTETTPAISVPMAPVAR